MQARLSDKHDLWHLHMVWKKNEHDLLKGKTVQLGFSRRPFCMLFSGALCTFLDKP